MINSILVWNCPGARARRTLRHLQKMITMHRISMVALLETRVHSKNFVSTFHSEVMTVEARGFAGGIWLMWNRQDIEVEEISSNDQILNVLVWEERRAPFLLSFVYASPNILTRAELWQFISHLGEFFDIPWADMGDFIQLPNIIDKFGGRLVNLANANKLRTTINKCRLIDMGFQRPRFTWTNSRTGTTNNKGADKPGLVQAQVAEPF